MEVELGLRTSAGMTNAKAIYTQGGNSKVYAEFTGTAAGAYTTAGRCAATFNDGSASGAMSLKSSVTAGAGATFKCLYPTTAVQATYQMCRVGGLQTTTTTGCIDAAQTITITEAGVATTTIAGGTATITNKAGRTLQGFRDDLDRHEQDVLGVRRLPVRDLSRVLQLLRRSRLRRQVGPRRPRRDLPHVHEWPGRRFQLGHWQRPFARASTRSRRAPPT